MIAGNDGTEGNFDFDLNESGRAGDLNSMNGTNDQQLEFHNQFSYQQENEALQVRQRAHQENKAGGGHMELDSEAARIGGNMLNVKDPSCPPYKPFYLMTTGHIQSGTMNDRDGIHCSFDFHAGVDWVIHSVSLHFVRSYHFLCRAIKLEFPNMRTKHHRQTEGSSGISHLSCATVVTTSQGGP